MINLAGWIAFLIHHAPNLYLCWSIPILFDEKRQSTARDQNSTTEVISQAISFVNVT